MLLRRATSGDLSAIRELLVAAGLPPVGLEQLLPGFVLAVEGSTIVGAAAVEDCGSQLGLLRSVVVSPAHQGRGVGHQLVRAAMENAKAEGKTDLYLLTTTAESYFPAFGFSRIGRDAVPDDVRATEEFREACPASATVMTARLVQGL